MLGRKFLLTAALLFAIAIPFAQEPQQPSIEVPFHGLSYAMLSTDRLLELYQQQNGRCAKTGLPMTTNRGQGRCWTNVSVDRIDPTHPGATQSGEG